MQDFVLRARYERFLEKQQMVADLGHNGGIFYVKVLCRFNIEHVKNLSWLFAKCNNMKLHLVT